MVAQSKHIYVWRKLQVGKQKKPGYARLFLLFEAYLEIFIWVNRNTVQTNLVVNMGTCRAPGIPHRRDTITSSDPLTDLDVKF